MSAYLPDIEGRADNIDLVEYFSFSLVAGLMPATATMC